MRLLSADITPAPGRPLLRLAMVNYKARSQITVGQMLVKFEIADAGVYASDQEPRGGYWAGDDVQCLMLRAWS